MVSLTERMPEITLLIFIDDQLLNVDEEWVAPTDAIAPSNYKTLNIVFSRIRRLLATGSLFYVWDLETTPTANSHSFIAGIRDLPLYLAIFYRPTVHSVHDSGALRYGCAVIFECPYFS